MRTHFWITSPQNLVYTCLMSSRAMLKEDPEHIGIYLHSVFRINSEGGTVPSTKILDPPLSTNPNYQQIS